MDDKLNIGWRWQDFGSGPTLVTDGRGAQVIMTARVSMNRGDNLWTRDNATGRLRAIDAQDADREVMAAIAAVPDMVKLLLEIRDGQEFHVGDGTTQVRDIDAPDQRAHAILAKIGL